MVIYLLIYYLAGSSSSVGEMFTTSLCLNVVNIGCLSSSISVSVKVPAYTTSITMETLSTLFECERMVKESNIHCEGFYRGRFKEREIDLDLFELLFLKSKILI